MNHPSFSANRETDRLNILSSYQILDSDSEVEYEEITELAAKLCDAPIAFISFVAEDRQWFKTCKGFSVSEIDRHLSVCDTVIEAHRLVAIRDLSQDQRFKDHPFITEQPAKKFYAGVPIKSEDGFVLGTLCVLDHKAKDLKDHESFALHALARQVETCLELRKRKNDQHNLEGNLESLNKTSSLGLMTAYVAHEINNSLGILSGYTSILSSELVKRDPKDELLTFVRKIEATNCRISRVIKGIKTYTRDTVNDPFELTPVKRLIEETVALCEQRCKRLRTQLIVKIPDGNLEVECHSTQLSQVFVNLINNSLDAVCELETRWLCIEAEVDLETATVDFSISDSGKGIPETIAKNLMEPFFTTKAKGKGTGLGLSISKSIVESHHGRFFYDRESANTKFRIQLPLRQK